MNESTIKIAIETTNNNRLFELLEPLPIEINDTPYVIPIGFVSDGQSVPRCLWILLDAPICGVTLIPSIKHDWLYKMQITTRKQADQIYLQDLINSGWKRWKCRLTYVGLRWFGWKAWNKHKRDNCK